MDTQPIELYQVDIRLSREKEEVVNREGYKEQDRMITALFVTIYVLVVCSILFCIVIAIIRCIR